MTTDLGSGVRVEVLKYQVPARWLAQPERSGLGQEWLGDAAAHLAGGGSVTFGLRGDDPEPTSTHLIVRAKAEETGAARLGSEEPEVSTLLASLSLPAEYPLTRTTTANLIAVTTH